MAKSRNSKENTTDLDLALALELQREPHPLGVTENAVFPDHRNKENYEPRTLVDQTLEIIDPTPNIYTLFMQFNVRFFSNKLLSVEVKWSNRMTTCAGVCTFRPRSRDCVITLSAPLLKLRPRKDLVETLLHEMIHGFLFLTNNNRDRDGHGPEFCKHMHRINNEAGTNITIYHSFHDEVKLYQQHWWRCNGPCVQRPPYFGMVRRAMNRAPGPSDFWWKKHQEECGGQYIKVKEPEKTNQKTSTRKTGDEKKKPKVSEKGKGDNPLDNYFKNPQVNAKPVSDPRGQRFVPTTTKASPAGLVKLGTATNNVHGWGTGGPGSCAGKSANISKPNPTSSAGKPNRALSFTGAVGGVGTGRSNLLDKFSSPTAAPGSKLLKKPSTTIILDSPPTKKSKTAVSTSSSTAMLKTNDIVDREVHRCPVCSVETTDINSHLDVCLHKQNSVIDITSSPDTPRISDFARKVAASTPKTQTTLDTFVSPPKKTASKHAPCPVCNDSFEMDLLNEHLDRCLTEPKSTNNTSSKGLKWPSSLSGPSTSKMPENFVDLTDATMAPPQASYVCLVCNARVSGDIALNDHLDECVQAIFNDSSIDDDYNNSVKPSSPEIVLKDDGFPCPLCMKIIPEKIMNQHLDTCLSG